MSDTKAHIFEHRSVIAVDGPDARAFLQGIISNDIDKACSDQAIWSAFLTPQGKFLHEFFVVEHGGRLLLDCESERRADLIKRLKIYKLRSKAEVADVYEDLAVAALFGPGALDALGLPAEPGRATLFAEGVAFVDPRHASVGARAFLPRANAVQALADAGFEAASLDAYDSLRIPLGLPDGSRDLEIEKTILLEAGFDELHGVDWQKGCYMGQELTARMYYRGLVKRRLVPVEIEGAAPPPGTPVTVDGKETGMLRSVSGPAGLATLRLEHLEKPGAEIVAGDARLTPRKPDWAVF